MGKKTKTRSPEQKLRAQLDLVELKPGLKFSKAVLEDWLPDVETALFFGKVYELDAQQLGELLRITVGGDVVDALIGGSHSTDLQDYIATVLEDIPDVTLGDIAFGATAPHATILPEVWKQLEVTVAASIKEVAKKLEGVVSHLPGKQGRMVFQSMMTMNAKRPIIGDYKAKIVHARQKENLLILDVSGSMTESTIRQIVDEVVGLAYQANAHLAIVSNSCTHWEPGAFDTASVLSAAEYGGTYYEYIAPLLERSWGTVITVADYDSSRGAKTQLGRCGGHIDEVIDISLVNVPTFLAECVGQLADKVTPILIGSTHYVLT